MSGITIERFRPAADAAAALAHAAALVAVFLAGELQAIAAVPLALLLVGAGVAMRAMLGSVEQEAPREEGTAHRGIAARLFPIYAFFASTTLVMYPEPFGPRSLFMLAFAEAPLLAAATSPRARTIADVNAGLLLAGATAAGGPWVRFAAAIFLCALPTALALRHLEERATAARWDGEEDLAPALAIGGAAATMLLVVFLLAATLLPVERAGPAPRVSGSDLAHAADKVARDLRVLSPRTIFAIVGALVLPFGALWLWKKISDWLRKRMAGGFGRRETEEGELSLGAPEALPDDAPPPSIWDTATSGRAGVVAAYRKLEAALAARDLGRANSEGASEHAAHLGERFPAAEEALEDVARRFAAARYGPDEPSEGAPRAAKAAADRALREIDREA